MVNIAEIEGDYSEHTRVVFLGKTGNGKSSSINNFIGTRFLESKVSSKSVTYNCQAVTTNILKEKYLVVDTPGLFDTERTQNEIFDELKNVMEFTYPGIDCFVIVISINRFTEEEQRTIEFLSNFFGKSINDYGIILFTRLDDLKRDCVSLENYISENKELETLVNNFGKRYVGFNNTLGMETEDMKYSIKTLIDKIKETKIKNKGLCYTTQLFESSQKAFKFELEKTKREKMSLEELNKQIENSNKQHKEELDKLQNKIESMVNQMMIDSKLRETELVIMRRKIEEEKNESDKYAKFFFYAALIGKLCLGDVVSNCKSAFSMITNKISEEG